MESFFEFLIDNPVIAIILISWLFSVLFGKKNKEKKEEQKKIAEQKAAEKKAARKAAIAEATATANATARSPFRDALSKLEEAIDQAEKNFNATAQKAQAPARTKSARKVPVAVISPPAPAKQSSDPYAFHSLMNPEGRTLEGKDYDSTVKDYDLTADDYDLTVKSFDSAARGFETNTDAYAFRSVTKPPAKRDFHTSNFRAFQIAHGLSKQDRVASPDTYGTRSASSIAASLFSNPNDVRRAFIMQEILNRPRGFRGRG